MDEIYENMKPPQEASQPSNKAPSVILEPITSYRVKNLAGKSLGVFRPDGDEWNGMQRFKGDNSQSFIANAIHPVERVFDGVFTEQPHTVEVVKASPDLIASIVAIVDRK